MLGHSLPRRIPHTWVKLQRRDICNSSNSNLNNLPRTYNLLSNTRRMAVHLNFRLTTTPTVRIS
jgi:hypothetical protein